MVAFGSSACKISRWSCKPTGSLIGKSHPKDYIASSHGSRRNHGMAKLVASRALGIAYNDPRGRRSST